MKKDNDIINYDIKLLYREWKKESGLEGLSVKQTFAVIWFIVSLIGLTISDDSPMTAYLIVWANILISFLLVKRIYSKKDIEEKE